MSLKSRLLQNREMKTLANRQDSSDIDFLTYFKEHSAIDKLYAYSYNKIFAEKNGKNIQLPLAFTTEDAYLSEITRIIHCYDGSLTEKKIVFNTKNSIIKILMPPLVNNEPYFSIERKKEVSFSEYFKNKLISSEISAYFRECLARKANIFIVGDFSVNKSMILNFLLNLTGDNNKNIVYDISGKIFVKKPCIINFSEGSLQNTVYTDYDNIFCSNVRQQELSQIFQLIVSGYNGFVVDLSIKSGVDIFAAIRNLILLENINLFEENADFLASSAIDVIVFTDNMNNGEVGISKISEVVKGNQNNIILKDIFTRNASGTHISTGNSSKFYNCENVNTFMPEYLEDEHIHNYVSGVADTASPALKDNIKKPKIKKLKEKIKKLKQAEKNNQEIIPSAENEILPSEKKSNIPVIIQDIPQNTIIPENETEDFSKEEIIDQTLFTDTPIKIRNIFDEGDNTDEVQTDDFNSEFASTEYESEEQSQYTEEAIADKYLNNLEPKIVEEPQLFSEITDEEVSMYDDITEITDENI